MRSITAAGARPGVIALAAIVALAPFLTMAGAAHAEDSRLERARKIRDEILAKRAKPAAIERHLAAPEPPAPSPAHDAAAEESEAARSRLARLDAELDSNRRKGEALAEPREKLTARSEELAATATELENKSRKRVEAVYRSAKLGPQAAGWGATAQESARLSRYLAAIAGAEQQALAKLESERAVVAQSLERARAEEAAIVAERRGLEADRTEAQAALQRAGEGALGGDEEVANFEERAGGRDNERAAGRDDERAAGRDDVRGEERGGGEELADDEPDADGADDEATDEAGDSEDAGDVEGDDGDVEPEVAHAAASAEEAELERELLARGIKKKDPEPISRTSPPADPATEAAKLRLEQARAKLAERARGEATAETASPSMKPGATGAQPGTPGTAGGSAAAPGDFRWPANDQVDVAKAGATAKPGAAAPLPSVATAKNSTAPVVGAPANASAASSGSPAAAPASVAASPPKPGAAPTQVASAAPVTAVAPATKAAPPAAAQPAASSTTAAPGSQPANTQAPTAVASATANTASTASPNNTEADAAAPAAEPPPADGAAPAKQKGFLSRIFGGSDRESDKFASARGSLAPPVAGKVVASYGQQHKSGATYRGVVLRAGHSAPIHAVAEGRVSFVGEVPGMGKTVIVSHGNRYHTVYARLGSVEVKEGDKIPSGAELGVLPDNDADMHFELRDKGTAVDPMPWLRGAR